MDVRKIVIGGTFGTAAGTAMGTIIGSVGVRLETTPFNWNSVGYGILAGIITGIATTIIHSAAKAYCCAKAKKDPTFAQNHIFSRIASSSTSLSSSMSSCITLILSAQINKTYLALGIVESMSFSIIFIGITLLIQCSRHDTSQKKISPKISSTLEAES